MTKTGRSENKIPKSLKKISLVVLASVRFHGKIPNNSKSKVRKSVRFLEDKSGNMCNQVHIVSRIPEQFQYDYSLRLTTFLSQVLSRSSSSSSSGLTESPFSLMCIQRSNSFCIKDNSDEENNSSSTVYSVKPEFKNDNMAAIFGDFCIPGEEEEP